MSREIVDVAARERRAPDQESQTPELPTNVRRPLLIGTLVLLMGFGGFVAWAAMAPIDSGVPAMGTVTLDNRRKTVQHFSGGLVKRILVKEGDRVKEGDLLMIMDDAIPQATRSSAESELRGLEIQQRFLEKLLADLKPLVDEGFYPRNRYLESQRQLAEVGARQAGQRDRLNAAVQELKRTAVVAPAAGMVMGLAITTEGGVISPGGRLMDIVPEDERLVIEAQIQPHLIDKVVPGLQAEVRFSALNLRATPIIMGEVEWVSADKFVNPQDMMNPMGFYNARLVVSPAEMKKLGDVHIRAGMPADVIFNTGERTFLEYLVRPLTDRMAKSLKEQ
jgi:protease secretion system membrane fusion protein